MWRALKMRLRSSLRYKLWLLVLFPVFLIAPLGVGFIGYWTQHFSHDQLLRKAIADLSIAHDIFNRLQRDLINELERLAGSHSFFTAYRNDERERLANQLAAVLETTRLDFLHVTDPQGRWVVAAEPTVRGGESRHSPLRGQATSYGISTAGIEVFSREDLGTEGLVLAPLEVAAPETLASTRDAPPIVAQRALVMRVIVPIRDPAGTIVALLDGGVVLNQEAALVDEMRDIVYGSGTLPEGGFGIVSIFLGDVRISTNATFERGGRAIGTRAPAAVRARVLGQGAPWVGRSRVVDDWYISSFEPIVDVYGNRVGMLSVGYLERPFREAYRQALFSLVSIVLAGLAIAMVIAITAAASIFRPIERMTAVVRATQAGEEQRIGAVTTQDEIGELARQFDRMLDLLRQRSDEIRRAAGELENKVDERTRELRANNARLEHAIAQLLETRRQLVVAEKMAALGELTAGVAHEVNNPTAVILGNVQVLRDELGAQAARVDPEIELIIEQVDRIRSIIDRLLRYARPSEFGDHLAELNLPNAIENALGLIEHELKGKQVSIARAFESTRTVRFDPQELGQVLINVLTNATQALGEGGRIVITVRDWADRGVAVTIEDNGIGIAPENLHRIFDPFFTRRKPGGTGLGLSVSYGIMRRYGGDISVESKPGEWTRFTLLILESPERPHELAPDSTQRFPLKGQAS